MTATDTHRAIEAVWRIESARLIAGLARLVGDVGLAEDLAQDALVAALERWPQSGVPDRPGAWLMATAKHRAIDQLRRRSLHQRKEGQLGHELRESQGTWGNMQAVWWDGDTLAAASDPRGVGTGAVRRTRAAPHTFT